MRIFRRVIARSWLFFTTVSSFRVYKEIKAILRSKFKYGVLSLRFFFRQILAAPVIIHLSRRRFPNFLCVKCFISNYLVNFCENGNDFAICMYLPPLCCVISFKKSTEDNQRVTCFNMFSIISILDLHLLSHFHFCSLISRFPQPDLKQPKLIWPFVLACLWKRHAFRIPYWVCIFYVNHVFSLKIPTIISRIFLRSCVTFWKLSIQSTRNNERTCFAFFLKTLLIFSLAVYILWQLCFSSINSHDVQPRIFGYLC